MNRERHYFLISLVIHILFIGIAFFFSSKLNVIKKYFTTVSTGKAFSVSVVNNIFERRNNNEQLSVSKKTNYKHTLDYPINENSNLSITEKLTKKEKVNKKELSTGSGGKDGENVEVIPLDKNNKIINFTPPIYPKSCLALGQEGTVIVRVLVSNEGKIIDNIIYKSSGYKLLDNAVIASSKLWTVNYPPLKTSWVEIVVNFIIN